MTPTHYRIGAGVR